VAGNTGRADGSPFQKINLKNPSTYQDELEFSAGQIGLLTHLRAGHCATLLQLPGRRPLLLRHELTQLSDCSEILTCFPIAE
jgi:hypothetical protein